MAIISATKETEVYSSYQWFHVLDTLLEFIFTELFENTSLIEYYASQLLIFQHTNKRKAVSLTYKWEKTISVLASFLAEPTLNKFLKLNLDRGYSQSMIVHFQNIAKDYHETYSNIFGKKMKLSTQRAYLDLETYHSAVGLKHSKDMIQTINSINYWYSEYLKIRNQIVLNYSTYLQNKAQYDANKTNFGVDQDDLQQNYYLAANRAVNHFNKDKGTFKSYLDLWLRKAKMSGNHFRKSGTGQYNIGDKEEILGHDENAPSIEVDILSEMDPTRLKELTYLIDPDGYFYDLLKPILSNESSKL